MTRAGPFRTPLRGLVGALQLAVVLQLLSHTAAPAASDGGDRVVIGVSGSVSTPTPPPAPNSKALPARWDERRPSESSAGRRESDGNHGDDDHDDGERPQDGRDERCPRSHGYWKTHPDAWPVGSLVLGNPANPSHTYARSKLLTLLKSPSREDASLILAHQLIAARLNLATGTNPTPIAAALARADRLLGEFPGRLPYRLKPSRSPGRAMVETAGVLERYNAGRVEGSCGGSNHPPRASAGVDQTVGAGSVVTLDGSASSDLDGDPLTFGWSFTAQPAACAALLSDPSAVMPTFIAACHGSYELALIVNDGVVDSALDTVRVSTQNSPPVAIAGPDQTVPLGQVVQLDGRASTDPDGDVLTFAWSLVSIPAGSIAALSDPTAATPTFVLDRSGNYVVELVVSDGVLSSLAVTVTISTRNSPPLADPGADQTIFVGDTVTLDGSGSSDVDGDQLTFVWSFTAKPAGSLAALSAPTAVNPSFAVDSFGVYVVQLIVDDGIVESAPRTVTITTLNSQPVANAGPDQVVSVRDLVQLTAGGSTDVDGDLLTYGWSLTTTPVGSAATLSDPTAIDPAFVADLQGSYVAQLIVNDGTVSSAPDTVTIDTQNQPPVASPGANQTVGLDATVQLDGSASSDPNGDPLSFAWSLLSVPQGSTATLSDPTAVDPIFVADRPGSYVAQLIVNDGTVDSAPATVTVSTEDSVPIADAGPDQSLATGSTAQLDGSGSFDPDGTPLSFFWSLLSRPAGSTATLSDPASVAPTFVANIAGVYVAQLIVGDGALVSAPDTVMVTVANGADLRITFFGVPTAPPVGSFVGLRITVTNLGPTAVSGATASFRVPAGYTVESIAFNPPGATYDSATGTWTMGSIQPPFGSHELTFGLRVKPAGPYDLVATITGSSAPDPNLANNTMTAVVTPNPNADLRISFNPFSLPTGTLAYGSSITWNVNIRNDGPAGTTGVTARALLPAGYTFTSANVTTGTYNATTGDWTIGSIPFFSGAGLTIAARVNTAPGPLNLSATITGSNQPDPNLANNTVTAAPANRPPIASAGPDQSVATGAAVLLDGSGSTDPDGDPFVLQWDFALRPASSAAAFTGATTATPSFTPDLPGPYVPRLTLTDSHGATSAADTVTITAAGFSRAPIILSSPVTAGAVSQPYRYEVDAVDPDAGDTLTFSLTIAPAGMTIDPATGVVQWNPAATQSGPQDVTVRVQDQRGLFAEQGFAVQVSSAANQAPVATDDTYEVRVSESLGVGAPGVLDNDTDADGNPLAATLLTQPGNGTVLLSSDGSFTFTPHGLREGDLVALDNVNLATRVPGVMVESPGALGSFGPVLPVQAADDDLGTSRQSFFVIAPFADIVFPMDVTVTELQLFGHRNPFLLPHRAAAGFFQLFDVSGAEIFNSGVVDLPLPDRDARQTVPSLAGVRRARFSITATQGGGGGASGFADFKVIGSAVIRRVKPVPEPNLGQLLPTVVRASSVDAFFSFNTAEGVIDDNPRTNWYSATHAAGEFLELVFPADVTVTQIVTHNPSATPQGFGSSIGIDCNGHFTLIDANDAVLFDSGVVRVPFGGVQSDVTFTQPVPDVAGVRRVRYTSAGCIGTGFPPGFSELRVFGSASVTTPAFSMARKFHALVGREVHSTPLVINLTDDNFDGVIDTRDMPDIVVPVESLGNQLTGEIKLISGDDGRELRTIGGPNLVSPWAEAAVGDIDGDGLVDIVAVHSDGNHLIAFDHTGAVKWISDANPMPRFALGGGTLIGGAVALANLDAAGPPEIVVGASVFDAAGRLLGDGRTLGGTTGGIGLRSAISAVADLDLDGIPEIVAGPTAYRLINGLLTIVWERTDRADGYVAIGNFDDDPFPEIVIVANGQVYMLNHDGTDAEVWNPPAHAPVPLPAGGQGGAPTVADLDGDGVPEIGVAGGANYVVFNRDGSVRWTSVISDRSSNSTGATVFDFDGDGRVEIVYRDEVFLRVYRGSDGVLLAKTPIGSATWAEQPVVADVDNDGHADIVVTSDLLGASFIISNTGVHVLHDVANQWARTRRIWNQHSYHITNVNEDGTIPLVETPNWLVPGLNNFRLNAFLAGESADGTDSFTYVAADATLESNIATVHITIRPDNSPPRITSTPVTTAAPGLRYVYGTQASDPDAGDVLTFSLPTAPAGMTIDPSFGLIQWTPTAGQLGGHNVVVRVQDARGAFALQGYAIQVASAVTVPDVVGQPQSAAQAAITTATLAVGSITTRSSAGVPAGSVISQNPTAGTPAAPGTAVSLVVSLGPPPVGTVPDVVGLPQASAEADITAAGFIRGTVAGQNSTLVPLGIVLSQDPLAGMPAVSGSAVNLVVSLGPPPGDFDLDGDGVTGNQGDCDDTNPNIHPGAVDVAANGIDENCNGVDSVAGDGTPPTVSIDAPSEDAIITIPTDIVGTATDVNFLRYTLELAGVDDPTFTVLASVTTPVVSGVLGRLDPTLLENGMYRVRLTAEDVNGQTVSAEHVYRVGGEAKVGVMALSFVDLQVPVSGIPITVIRSYDSRVKTQEDFGIGWSLEIKHGKYQHNRPPGQGWIISDQPFLGSFVPCVGGNVETRSHLTEVRLSDREVYTFALTVTGANLGITGACEATAGFRFIDGTTPGATLEILDGTSVIYLRGGADEVLDETAFLDGTSRVYDPQRVRLTTIDGRKIDLDRSAGITCIEDLNGNALSITAGGIVHSSGKSIAFARDSAGRITRITDPQGNTLSYGYDVSGDLTSFIDQAANQTTFSYDTRHNLLEIHDPLGNRAGQSEYDADGRLVAIIDAQGNRIVLTHYLGMRQEVITDRLGGITVHEYDDAGNITATTDAQGNRREFTFDSRGNQLTEKDPLGRIATRTYDAFDNILTSVDFDGNTTSSTYDSHGQVLTVTDPEGRVTSNVYDARANLVQVTNPEGGISRYTRNAAGNVIALTDPLGKTTTSTYDAAGNLVSQTDALGQITTATYDAAGNLLSEQRTRALTSGGTEAVTTGSTFDPHNLLTSRTDRLGNPLSFTYTAAGQTETATDARGNTARNIYDATGNLIQTLFHDGSHSASTYDAEGRELTRTGRDGDVSRFQYDALGRQVAVVHPDSSSASRTYDSIGRVATVDDERGNQSRFNYGTNAQTTIDALGGTTVYTFDSKKNRTHVTDALSRTTSFEYDSRSHLIETVFADGSIRAATYDTAGRKVAETNQAGRTTQFDNDPLGRLVQVTDPAGQITTFSYDALGNLTSQTDAEGRVSRMEYDAGGRLIGRSRPLGQRESLAYDANGNLASRTDFDGQTTTFNYDSNNRLISKTFPDGTTIAYAYTPGGLRTTAGGDTYAYDTRGRLVQVITAGGDDLSYTYDAAGNRTSITTAQGTTAFTYDVLNRLASVTDATGTTTFAYDAVGNLASRTYPNGVTVTYTYDSLNRLTLLENSGPSGLISSYTYTLAADGKRTTLVESGPATTGRIVDYTYDSVDRLITEQIDAPGTSADQTITYQYDSVGNRLSKMVVDGTGTTDTRYTYDDNDRVLSEITTVTIASLPAGHGVRYVLAGYGFSPVSALIFAVGLTWSRRRELKNGRRRRFFLQSILVLVLVAASIFAPMLEMIDSVGLLTPRSALAQSSTSTSSLTYSYDNNGNTLSRSDGTNIDTYTYDAENRLIAADVQIGSQPGLVTYGYDADGIRTSKTENGVTTRYLVDKNRDFPQVLVETGGAATVTYTYGLDLMTQTRSGSGTSFYLFDGQGSTRQLASVTGAVTDTYTYDAFGELLASTGTTTNVYLYNGEQLDPNLGFYYLRARYYMQALGRFLTTDPFEGTSFDPVSLHRYLYANADPVNKSDPSGLSTLLEFSVSVAVTTILFTLSGALVGAIGGGLAGGAKGAVIGALIGAFLGFLASPFGRSLLLVAGEKLGVVTLSQATRSGVGRVTAATARGARRAGGRATAILPFLPFPEQQPEADRIAGEILREDPDGGLLFLNLLLGFLNDALSQPGHLTIGPGPDSVRPFLERLYDLVRNATPMGPPLEVIDDEE